MHLQTINSLPASSCGPGCTRVQFVANHTLLTLLFWHVQTAAYVYVSDCHMYNLKQLDMHPHPHIEATAIVIVHVHEVCDTCHDVSAASGLASILVC